MWEGWVGEGMARRGNVVKEGVSREGRTLRAKGSCERWRAGGREGGREGGARTPAGRRSSDGLVQWRQMLVLCTPVFRIYRLLRNSFEIKLNLLVKI